MGNTSKGAVKLCSNASATGSAQRFSGGRVMLIITATFGGGTVKLQTLAGDGATWVDVTGGSMTAAGTASLDLPSGQYRINIATATAVYADFGHVPE